MEGGRLKTEGNLSTRPRPAHIMSPCNSLARSRKKYSTNLEIIFHEAKEAG